MADSKLSFFARLALSFAVFFRVLFDAVFAGRVLALKSETDAAAPLPAPQPAAPKLHQAPTDSALQLLGLLQREGRFIDFVQEDVSSYSDVDIGAAARVVHDSVRKALDTHMVLERVRGESEGERVTLPKGFSASEVRVVGNVVGDAPFTGTLTHAGWRVKAIELPRLADGHDLRIVAPAEVEL